MGVRYVWDRYSLVDTPSGTFEEKSSSSSVLGSYETTRVKGHPTAWTGCTSRPVGPNADGTYSPAGTTMASGDYGGASAVPQNPYRYLVLSGDILNRRRYYYNPGSYSAYWGVTRRYSTDADYYVELWGPNNNTYAMYVVEAVEGTTKGPGVVQGSNSSSSSSAYPANGVSGSYWYSYRGSDNIDPTALSYSTTAPKGGETITVTVTPRSNTYGGTVYYQYSYSTDGGATWTNSGSKTTSPTKSFSIAKGSTQFRARVVASDNYGFTSTTYITGSNLVVVGKYIYLGVNSKARQIKNLYIGINGKARKIIKGYIGVGGIAKRIL